MGIGATMKNMLSSDNADPERDSHRHRDTTTNEEPRDSTGLTNEPGHATNSNRAARQLPPGTGPGTSGKADANRPSQGSNFGDITGYGTDAAAAAGGSLSNTHQVPGHTYVGADHSTSTTGNATTRDVSTSASASGPDASTSTKRASQAARENVRNKKGDTSTSGIAPTTNLTGLSENSEIGRYGDKDVRVIHQREVNQRDYDVPRHTEGARRTETLSGNHQFGHTKHSAKDSMPPPNAEEDTNQLQPVTHERVRHLETEEISHVKELERHIHHVQHHTQPIVASEELPEQIREQLIPVTTVKETHSNNPEDSTLFESQVHKHHDTLIHADTERTVIDKGTTVKEHVHHHIHHVIQPVIEKETIDKQRIHTTVPIHAVTHEAPLVHQSQTHSPVALEHFLTRGGTLEGAIPHDRISQKVLRTGPCAREVDGVAENLDKHLKGSGVHGHSDTKKVSETDEQIRTTVAPMQN